MSIVCQATQAKTESIVLPALECLARIMQLYYPHMAPYMQQAVARLTIDGIGAGEEAVALQAIEFWSTVCEIERDLQEAEACDFPSQGFARGALTLLLPALLAALKEQEEERNDPDSSSDDAWNRAMAAGTCLSLLAECVGDEIFAGNTLMTFVSGHITSSNWKLREAAVMAFGSVMDGPSSQTMGPYVAQGLPVLLGLLADGSVAVRDTTAWAVGRIIDFFNDLVTDETLSAVVLALAKRLEDAPRVASNCCWSLMSAFVHGGDEDNQLETSPLSAHHSQVLSALFAATQRPDADANNLRPAAYQSLASVALFAPMDCTKAIGELQVAILEKLHGSQALAGQIVNADDRMRYSELQSNLCVVLQNCVKKLGPANAEVMAERIMACALSIFANAAHGRGSATELEDVLLLVGTLIGEMEGSSFARYVDALMPYLLATLGNHAEYHLCTVAVGVVGDLARALGAALRPYCDSLVGSLLLILQDGSIMRDIKPHAISALGDVALGLEGAFASYLTPTMQVLILASQVSVQDAEDYDELDFVAALRESLLDAYTSLVLALRADPQAANALAPYMPQIIDFVRVVAQDSDRSDAMVRAAIGLIGDIMDTFGPAAKPHVLADWLVGFIQQPLGGGEGAQLSDATRSIMYRTQNVRRRRRRGGIGSMADYMGIVCRFTANTSRMMDRGAACVSAAAFFPDHFL